MRNYLVSLGIKKITDSQVKKTRPQPSTAAQLPGAGPAPRARGPTLSFQMLPSAVALPSHGARGLTSQVLTPPWSSAWGQCSVPPTGPWPGGPPTPATRGSPAGWSWASLLPVGGTRAGAPGSPSVLSPLPRTRSSAQPVGPSRQQPGWEPEAETGCWVHPGNYTQVGRGPLTARPSLRRGRGRGRPMPCGRSGSRGPVLAPRSIGLREGRPSGQAAAGGLFIRPGQAASLKSTNQR